MPLQPPPQSSYGPLSGSYHPENEPRNYDIKQPSLDFVIAEAFQCFSDPVKNSLIPLRNDAIKVKESVYKTLDEYKVHERDVLSLLNGQKDLSVGSRMEPDGELLEQLAAQYKHVSQVLETSIRLKGWMLEHGLPNETYSYYAGTGFPLPEENNHVQKVGMIGFGDKKGPLKHLGKARVIEHEDPEGGIHAYKVTADNGNQSTLLVVKGRPHGYEKVDTYMARLNLAVLPRVLKGVGVDLNLACFASGVDHVALEDSPYKMGDYAVLVGSDSFSALGQMQDPGIGDQTINFPIFGARFQTDAKRIPDPIWVRFVQEAFRRAHTKLADNADNSPQLHHAILVDTLSEPHFEGAVAHITPRLAADAMEKYETLPRRLTKLFPDIRAAIVHGMSSLQELRADFISNPFGLQTRWNRVLPTIAMANFTDYVDPQKGSLLVSHENVQEQAAKSAAFVAPVISDLFTQLTEQSFLDLAGTEADKLEQSYTADIKNRMPNDLDDVRYYLMRMIDRMTESVNFYHSWGISNSAKNQSGFFIGDQEITIQEILDSIDVGAQLAYDYFLHLRDHRIERIKYIISTIKKWPQSDEDEWLEEWLKYNPGIRSVDDLEIARQNHIKEAWRAEESARLIAAAKGINHRNQDIEFTVYGFPQVRE